MAIIKGSSGIEIVGLAQTASGVSVSMSREEEQNTMGQGAESDPPSNKILLRQTVQGYY